MSDLADTSPRRRASWAQLANLFGEAGMFLLSGALLFILISRLAGSELLGSYALISAWTLVFQAIAAFGVPELVMRDVGRVEDGRSRYLGHALALGAGASLVATAVMALLVLAAGYPPAVRNALWISSLTLVPMTIIQVCRSGFIAQHRSEYALLVRLAEFAVVFPTNVWLVLHGRGIEALATAILGGRVLAGAVALAMLHRWVIPVSLRFERDFARGLLPSLAIFGLSNSLGLVAQNTNVILLSLFAPIDVVGHYSAASKVVDLMMMLPVVVAHLNLPQIARAVAGEGPVGIRRFDHRLTLLFAVTIPLACGVALFADRIVALLYGAAFAASATVLRVLMVYYVLQVVDINTSITLKASGRERDDVRLFSVNPLLNVVIDLVAIPWFGAIGAACASATSVLATLALRYRFLARNLVAPGWLRLARAPLALCAVAAFAVPLARAEAPDVLVAALYAVSCLALFARAARVPASTWGAASRLLRNEESPH